MSDKTIGTCSICAGPVTVPAVWMGVHPPTPSCGGCGAVPEAHHGPVINMRPRPRPEPAHVPSLWPYPYVYPYTFTTGAITVAPNTDGSIPPATTDTVTIDYGRGLRVGADRSEIAHTLATLINEGRCTGDES